METTHKAKRSRLTKYNKPPQVAKAHPKSVKDLMNQKNHEFSRVMDKHDNPRKWRENHGGWVGNKRQQFSQLTSFTLSTEKLEKNRIRQNLQENAVTNSGSQ